MPEDKRRNIHALCCEDNILIFSKGKFKLFDSLFHAVYHVFSIRLISTADLLAVHYMWDIM